MTTKRTRAVGRVQHNLIWQFCKNSMHGMVELSCQLFALCRLTSGIFMQVGPADTTDQYRISRKDRHSMVVLLQQHRNTVWRMSGRMERMQYNTVRKPPSSKALCG